MTNLHDLHFRPEYVEGSYNAVNTCLRIQTWEKVTVITDYACQEIALAIVRELDYVGCAYKTFVLEEISPRPLIEMPFVINSSASSMEFRDHVVAVPA